MDPDHPYDMTFIRMNTEEGADNKFWSFGERSFDMEVDAQDANNVIKGVREDEHELRIDYDITCSVLPNIEEVYRESITEMTIPVKALVEN